MISGAHWHLLAVCQYFGVPKSESAVTDFVVCWHFMTELVFGIPKSDTAVTDCVVCWHLSFAYLCNQYNI